MIRWSIERIGYFGMLAVVLFGSFFLTLSIIGPSRQLPDASESRPVTELLSEHPISNYSELNQQASAVGLKPSQSDDRKT
jgi:hypothetical protein